MNFYDLVEQDPEQYNPGFEEHGIHLPFRILIEGKQGSGKTNSVMIIIKYFNGTFERVIICCRSKDEPLYRHLEKIGGECVEFFEDGYVPNLDSINNCSWEEMEPTLIVFDDLILMKDQVNIEEYFIRARKKKISCIYLSQSYSDIPARIKRNCDYFIMMPGINGRILGEMLRSFSGEDTQTLKSYYRQATKRPLNFLFIDQKTENPDLKFRINIDNEII